MNERGLPFVIVVAVLLLVVGAACAGDDDSSSGIQAEASSTIAVTPQSTPAPPTATALPPTQPAPTQPPPTAPPPADAAKFPTLDTRVAIRDLPTVNQIQLSKDGNYFIADRGDGCTWVEVLRLTDSELGETVILHTDCLAAGFAIAFRPASGEVFMLIS